MSHFPEEEDSSKDPGRARRATSLFGGVVTVLGARLDTLYNLEEGDSLPGPQDLDSEEESEVPLARNPGSADISFHRDKSTQVRSRKMSDSEEGTSRKKAAEKPTDAVFAALFDGKTRFGNKTLDQSKAFFTDLLAKAGSGLTDEWTFKLFGYAGFDVLAFREMLARKANQEDVAFMCFCFLVRGNNLERLKDATLGVEVKKRIKSLESSLKLKKNAAGKNMNVTLGRVAIAFPEAVASVLHHIPNMPGPVSLQQAKTASGEEAFPGIGRQSALACLLPREHKDSIKILNIFMLSNLMVSTTINQKNEDWKKKTKTEQFDSTLIYQLNAFNSALMYEEIREKWCEDFGIIAGGRYTPNWRASALGSAKALFKAYGKYLGEWDVATDKEPQSFQ